MDSDIAFNLNADPDPVFDQTFTSQNVEVLNKKNTLRR